MSFKYLFSSSVDSRLKLDPYKEENSGYLPKRDANNGRREVGREGSKISELPLQKESGRSTGYLIRSEKGNGPIGYWNDTPGRRE